MFTTMEKLQGQIGFDGAVIRYADRVLVASPSWDKETGFGYVGRIYSNIEDPNDDIGFIESRLEDTLSSTQVFPDAGHAIEWAITTLHTL